MSTFHDSQRSEAEDARLTLELRLRNQGIEREIVMLEAANEIALRKTHRRYFENWEKLAKAAGA
jgi:hypothetical protein